jgi:hypothetical protein
MNLQLRSSKHMNNNITRFLFFSSNSSLLCSIGRVSESGDFTTLFFLVRQHWGGCRYRHFAANIKAFVAMEPWTGAQCDFAVKAFCKTSYSDYIEK